MFNNQFNAPQQPYMNPMFYGNSRNFQPQANVAPLQQNNHIVWVNGIEGAKGYQLEPNSNILLLDSDTEGKMYIKTCDNVGMCNLRIFDYMEVTDTPAQPQVDTTNFVTKDEMQNAINQAVERLQMRDYEKDGKRR